MNDSTDEPLADYAIDLYWYCKEFNCLPYAGGVLEQDYLLSWLLKQVGIAVHEKEELEYKKSSKGRR